MLRSAACVCIASEHVQVSLLSRLEAGATTLTNTRAGGSSNTRISSKRRTRLPACRGRTSACNLFARLQCCSTRIPACSGWL